MRATQVKPDGAEERVSQLDALLGRDQVEEKGKRTATATDVGSGEGRRSGSEDRLVKGAGGGDGRNRGGVGNSRSSGGRGSGSGGGGSGGGGGDTLAPGRATGTLDALLTTAGEGGLDGVAASDGVGSVGHATLANTELYQHERGNRDEMSLCFFSPRWQAGRTRRDLPGTEAAADACAKRATADATATSDLNPSILKGLQVEEEEVS